MPNQYSSITKENILRKMNRQSNPVTSLTQLAREFGSNVTYVRSTPGDSRFGKVDVAVRPAFRAQVRSLIGETQFNRLRRRKHINRGFEGSLRNW